MKFLHEGIFSVICFLFQSKYFSLFNLSSSTLINWFNLMLALEFDSCHGCDRDGLNSLYLEFTKIHH